MVRGKNSDRLSSCQCQHILIRHLAAYEDNAADIEHLGCTYNLRIAKTGDEHGTFSAVCKDITHHIGRKNELYI